MILCMVGWGGRREWQITDVQKKQFSTVVQPVTGMDDINVINCTRMEVFVTHERMNEIRDYFANEINSLSVAIANKHFYLLF